MRKIPTLFIRDPFTHLKYVKPEVHPDCQWVLDGEGVATRKYDGTCVAYNGESWWARREVKAGKPIPPNYQPVETDENTGKTVGWEPMHQSAFAKYCAEAVDRRDIVMGFRAGTYELCGPRINGNPEGYRGHFLIEHADAERLSVPSDYGALAEFMRTLPHEGVVWHHPDGRMAKLKRKDFPEWRSAGDR